MEKDKKLKIRKKRPIYAFIDSQNLNRGVKRAKWTLDFKKFRIYLRDKYKVKKAFLFIGEVSGNEKLYAALKDYGYKLVFKPTVEVKKGKDITVKGNVDAELVLHTMINIRSYHQAVVVTGDGDFHCLIEHLARRDKLRKLIVPGGRYSTLYSKYAKHIVSVNLFKEKVKLIKTKRIAKKHSKNKTRKPQNKKVRKTYNAKKQSQQKPSNRGRNNRNPIQKSKKIVQKSIKRPSKAPKIAKEISTPKKSKKQLYYGTVTDLTTGSSSAGK